MGEAFCQRLSSPPKPSAPWPLCSCPGCLATTDLEADIAPRTMWLAMAAPAGPDPFRNGPAT
jgi:hypothetical protein